MGKLSVSPASPTKKAPVKEFHQENNLQKEDIDKKGKRDFILYFLTSL